MTQSAKTAIITGGGTGVGRAVALTLASAGWNVVVAGRRVDMLAETAGLAPLGNITPIVVNVVDETSVDTLFDETVRRLGRLDLLFNNAGINAGPLPLEQLAVAAIRSVIEVNVVGSMLCARAAIRVMKAQTPQGGRIINNGSISAYAPRPNQAPYTASKSAITGLTKSIALEGRSFGIASGQIDIGNAATDMSSYMTSGAVQADGSIRPEPRIPVSQIGDTVLHMASLPIEANIPFLTVMATNMPLYGRG